MPYGSPSPILADIAAMQAAGILPSQALTSQIQALVSGGVIPVIPGGTLVLLGDSITDMCGGLRLSGSQENYPAQGYWSWAQSILGYRFGRVVNAGISGDTLEGMDSRFATDVAAYSPAVVSLFGGVNNSLSSVNAGNIEAKFVTATAAIASIYVKAMLINAALVIGTVSPFAPGAAPTSAMYQMRARLNQFIRNFVGVNKNAILADYAAAMTDPTTSGLAVGTTDGGPALIYDNLVHPSASGAMVIGTTLAAAISTWFNTARRLPFGKEPGQFVTNPTLAGSNGTSIPTNWNVASGGGITFSFAYADRSDGVAGKQIVCTQTAGTGEVRIFTFDTIDPSVAVGSKLIGAVEIELLQTAAQLTSAGIYLQAFNGSFATLATTDCMRDSSFNSGGLTRQLDAKSVIPKKMTLVTPPLVIPAGAATIGLTIQLYGPLTATIKSAVVFAA